MVSESVLRKLSFLVESQHWYDFTTATLVQGLLALGHDVFGWKANSQNYLTPHGGQAIDVIIQTSFKKKGKAPTTAPNVLLWGGDSGQGRIPVNHPNWRNSDACVIFVRDYRDGGNDKVFPFNMGIEDRYYCATHSGYKPLRNREIDLLFLGRRSEVRQRLIFLDELSRQLSPCYNVEIGEHKYNKPDEYWSKWVKGHCHHCTDYYDALANAKIILSPMGAGPDCARHWEAFASGGVPLVEFMPTVMVPPAPREGLDWITFRSVGEAVNAIDSILNDLDRAQIVADTAYSTGRKNHTTKARAAYFLSVLESKGLIP